jgi:GT2 family glycosyltransferase
VTRVDVVVLTWNDGVLLDKAVASALAQEGVTVRVIVVDNGSAPPAHCDPSVHLIRLEENLGVGGGRNVGVRAGDAPFVCFLDSDARLHAHALAALVAPMLDDSAVGLTAPVFTDQVPEASGGRAPTLGRKALRALNRTDVYARTPGQGAGDRWDVEFAIGACQVFRRAAFDAVGGLDDHANFGPEDVDFCLRVRERGWRVVQVASAGCDHPPRRAFKGLATRRGLHHARAVVGHLWRHRGGARRRRTMSSGDVEHALERDPRPLGGARVDGDLVHDLAGDEPVEDPGKVRAVDAEHRGTGADERVE